MTRLYILLVFEDGFKLFTLQSFFGDQGFDNSIELVAFSDDDLLGSGHRRVNHRCDFSINRFGKFFRVVPIFTDFSAEENHLFILAKSPRAQSGAHAVFGDELLGDFGGSLQVV